ncbi:MAG: hypothetical protein SFX19_06185 [Alphaproteobacteria bacterium]|nr:hypothetical protein [Alphaproteobacteria bacterium]
MKASAAIPKGSSVEVRYLSRREFENYLLDKEILQKFSIENNIEFDESKYDEIVKSIVDDDVKEMAPLIFKNALGIAYSKKIFLELAQIIADTAVYAQLRKEIFDPIK